MTSGTPESTQNWVLAGFQNSLDLASMSPLEAKAMSSSATVTSAPPAQHLHASGGRHAAHRRNSTRAAGHSAHPCPRRQAPVHHGLFGSTKRIPDVTD